MDSINELKRLRIDSVNNNIYREQKIQKKYVFHVKINYARRLVAISLECGRFRLVWNFRCNARDLKQT